MTHQTRLGKALERLASGMNVVRTRNYDSERAERNGDSQDLRLERAVAHFERAADELWQALDTPRG